MKVLVRQIATGLYWHRETGWVQAQDAEVFTDSGQAISYCIEKGIRDVHVILDFGDPKYDVVLHPFGEKGHEPTTRELIDASQALTAKSNEAARRSKGLLAGLLETVAELKERKKRFRFGAKDGPRPPED